jgi:fido (protein-threonine AMPylation protein)
MSLFVAGDGNTLPSPDEEAELIPNLATRQELNEWERLNIVEAHAWAFSRRNLVRRDPLDEPYVRELHRRMFDQTWRWAGRYRTTEKNIGLPCYQIRDQLAALLGDVRCGFATSSFFLPVCVRRS